MPQSLANGVGTETGPGYASGLGVGSPLPVYIAEAEPYRPEMVLWLELPDDYIVGQELIDPQGTPLSFSGTLLRSMDAPLVGAPRRPQRIRVCAAPLAMELRGAVPDIEVVVAPTPELDSVIAQMVASMPEGGGGPSYFEHGRVGVAAVAALFRAAAALFRSAPWKLAQDSQALRLDIPALGVEGACVSIIGALEESLGLVIFPSHLAMERFLARMEAGRGPDARLDMGTTTLSLNFERGADLPAGMRREAAEHGWPVASPAAYPWAAASRPRRNHAASRRARCRHRHGLRKRPRRLLLQARRALRPGIRGARWRGLH